MLTPEYETAAAEQQQQQQQQRQQQPVQPGPLPTPCRTPATEPDLELCPSPAAPELESGDRVSAGLRVLHAEAAALVALARLYETDTSARRAFDAAVRVVSGASARGGKVVVVGVGKSGLVGAKVAATLLSLGVQAARLHPTEALHGDVGLVQPGRDALLLITHSGRTPELLRLLPHLDPDVPAVVMTSHARAADCEVLRRRPGALLLPAPLPLPESETVGVAAPTASTAVAMALGDALAVAAARHVHGDVAKVFAGNHPGGAIGMATAQRS